MTVAEFFSPPVLITLFFVASAAIRLPVLWWRDRRRG